MRHTPEAGAVCGNSARTDLRGGRGVNLRPYRNIWLRYLHQCLVRQRACRDGQGCHQASIYLGFTLLVW